MALPNLLPDERPVACLQIYEKAAARMSPSPTDSRNPTKQIIVN
jgi:hypothetical protein